MPIITPGTVTSLMLEILAIITSTFVVCNSEPYPVEYSRTLKTLIKLFSYTYHADTNKTRYGLHREGLATRIKLGRLGHS
jgi:hypothetical protein